MKTIRRIFLVVLSVLMLSAVSCKAAELDLARKCRRLQLVVFGDPNSKRAVRYMKTVTAD